MDRRTIHFSQLGDVVAEAERLMESGYDRAGNWSLGQVCNHLAAAVDMTTRGIGSKIPSFMQRAFIATFLNLAFLGRYGNMLGLRVPTSVPQNIPIDDREGVTRLATAIEGLEAGGADHLMQFHLWHCQHHFSFLIPKGEPGSQPVATR